MNYVSVCVIGLNEEESLESCFLSIRASMELSGLAYEVIYIDSGSQDNSVSIAIEYSDVVGVLSPTSIKSAAAGRAAAASLAAGNWILHLDGDMVMRQEFSKHFARIVRGELGQVVTGIVDDVLPNGERRRNAKGYVQFDAEATHFGGVLIIDRTVLDAVGGWSAMLTANEELDLYVRLRAAGYRPWLVGDHVADHIGAQARGSRRAQALLPYPLGPTRNLGFPQVVRLATVEGRLGSLIRFYPKPFLTALSLVLAVLGLMTRSRPWAAVSLAILGGAVQGETLSRSSYHALLAARLVSVPLAHIDRSPLQINILQDRRRTD